MEKNYTINWSIQELKWIKTTGLVVKVTWKVDVELEKITKEKIGSLVLRKSGNTIPLEDLTEEIVLGWVKDNLGDKNKFHRPVDTIINGLKKLVDRELNSLTKQGLPWEIKSEPVGGTASVPVGGTASA
jgi:hypothetical protein